jgi:hypothetical protein
MASGVPPPHDKKRVKVYELRNNDWFDRGTGFCTGRVVNVSVKRDSIPRLGHSEPEPQFIKPRDGQMLTPRIGGFEDFRRVRRPTRANAFGDEDIQGRWVSETTR